MEANVDILAPRKERWQTIRNTLIIVLIIAMILDLRVNRIANQYLILIWGVGISLKFMTYGIQGLLLGIVLTLIPIVLLFFLFQIKALGGGDIKLFAAVGVYLALESLIQWMAFSFICGAVIGLVVLIKNKIVTQRIVYLIQYVKDQLLLFPNQINYQHARIGQENVIHFTIPMVLGYCLLLMKG